MRPIVKITEKETGKVVHEFKPLFRKTILNKDGSKKVLSHPYDEYIHEDKEQTREDLVYDKDKDEFCFHEHGKELPDHLVKIMEAKKYEITPVGIS